MTRSYAGYFRYFLSFLIGAVFLLSGISKLFPIEPFEVTFIELGIANWTTAPFISRGLIALELFLGFAFIFSLNHRKKVYQLAIAVLLVFTVYLFFLMAEDNSADCGCFGEWIPMTPLQSIIKNAILMAGIAYLYKHNFGLKLKHGLAVNIVLVVISIAGVFIVNPPEGNSTRDIYTERIGFRVPLEFLYSTPPNTAPDVDLKQGKWIVCYLSARCPHCKIAAQKIRVLEKMNPEYPFFVVINGKPEATEEFFRATRIDEVPHMRFKGKEEFIRMAGLSLPAIFCLRNGVIEKSLTTGTLNKKSVEAWLDN